ncbi:copper resistance protein CopC [Robertmurraya korlensis]|uniref:copper resistance CopC family protein n=1 Tax=Robertmurraya korlensis TaxID=519977 RepID=UPI00203FC582|nr:copper resistance protein CopC [Robertmurraya korlensis]MCM3601777.1 copper resistance protein CopC [Robertmurraya korlensis]
MKKLLIIFISLLVLILPSVVSAHTEITSSIPEAGQVVKEETKEITLTFGGEIESLSTMTLMKDGQDIKFESVQAQGNQLIGLLGTPLESGSYIINWNIVGGDGHPLTGEIPFSVQLTEEEAQDTTEEVPIKQDTTQEEKEVVTENNANNGNHLKTFLPKIAILLLAIGLVTLYRKKR